MAFKITFTLDEQDSQVLPGPLQDRAEEREGGGRPAGSSTRCKNLIKRVRSAERVPNFVAEAITTLEDLIQMLEDKDYQLPRAGVGERRGRRSPTSRTRRT